MLIDSKTLAVAADVTDAGARGCHRGRGETDRSDRYSGQQWDRGQGLAIEDIDEASFDAMVAVNMGIFLATQAVVPGMKEKL